METVKDGSPLGLGGQQARPETFFPRTLPLAPISMLCTHSTHYAGMITSLIDSTVLIFGPTRCVAGQPGDRQDSSSPALRPSGRIPFRRRWVQGGWPAGSRVRG